jgi:hypothetical protein
MEKLFFFGGEFLTTSSEYVDGATLIFLETSKTNSLAYWYVNPKSAVYTRGSFVRRGPNPWYFRDETSVWYNQGYMEAQNDWMIMGYQDNDPVDKIGTFYNVGILKLFDGAWVTVNLGSCNGGRVILADSSNSTFSSSNSISIYSRIAIDGDIELEVGHHFTFNYQLVISYTSSASKYPDDFDKGIPKTFKHADSYYVRTRDVTTSSFVKPCFDTFGLGVSTKGVIGSCQPQPSFQKGICETNLPPATVEFPAHPPSPSSPTSAPSSPGVAPSSPGELLPATTDSSTPKIVGGVIGGVIFLVIIAIIVLKYRKIMAYLTDQDANHADNVGLIGYEYEEQN